MTEIDGYLVNEDGEVVGLANLPVRTPQDEIEGVLERRAKANSKIAAITAEFDAMIKGFQERKERLVREQQQRIDYLDYTYGPMMEKYLLENRGKNKSLVMKWGTLGTRKSNKIVILDEDQCIAWCEQHAPGAVKYERSVLKKELPPECPFADRISEEKFYVEN